MVLTLWISLIGLIVGTLEDIRIREIPDLLNFSLIAIGLLSSLITSIINSDFRYLLVSISGLIAAGIIGFVFYYSGQWGGGDTKIMMGIGALVGIDIFNLGTIPLFLVFIVNAFIAGAVIGIFWSIFLAIKNWKKYVVSFREIRSKKINKRFRILFYFLIPLILLVIILLPLPVLLEISMLFIVCFIYLMQYLTNMIKAVEKSCMIKKIPVSKLVEGDWLTSDIKISENLIIKSGKTGLEMKDILILKKNKIKQVIVREGMPFAPSFLVAFIALIVFGNWLII